MGFVESMVVLGRRVGLCSELLVDLCEREFEGDPDLGCALVGRGLVERRCRILNRMREGR